MLLWIVENVLLKESLIGIDLACALSCVSKGFRDLFEQEQFWLNQFQILHIGDVVKPYLSKFHTWKELFIDYHLISK